MNKQNSSPTGGAFTPAQQTPPWWQTHRTQLISFAVLIALLLIVVFVLPQAVSTKPAPAVQGNSSAPSTKAGRAESPWSEAQLAKQRKEAQGVLADILKLQQGLEAQAVERWAGEAYKDAMNTASEGDAFYRLREFEQAQAQYRETLNKFQALADSANAEYEKQMNMGKQAIDQGDASAASLAFELAGLIRNDSDAAKKGLLQAQSLNGVLATLAQAKLEQKAGNLNEAKQLAQAALADDPDSTPARDLLSALNKAILERDFTAAMSEGYDALHRSKFSAAKKAFRRAIALKPSSNDANTALNQAGNQQTQVSIESSLAKAKQHESAEQWADALAQYEQALALDSSVVAARIGKIRSKTRLDLDQNLQALLDEPKRLTSGGVYQQAQQVLKDARELAASSPRLQEQTTALSAILKKAVIPQPVLLTSDEFTEITVYKIGRIGTFREHRLELKPGRYVAVGKRDGYRDVRAEFDVHWDKPSITVNIQCEERVASL